jgi:hypothetical protein
MRRVGIHLGNRTWLALAVFCTASLAAVCVARPYAGGWNDGSRLATVESLVDYRTLAIDRSIFASSTTPESGKSAPYAASDMLSTAFGTGDKLYIDGHYYSDKSPVPALGMGLAYYLIQEATGLRARDRSDTFCRALTLLTSGLAFAVSVTAMFVLFQKLGLPLALALAASASFGFSTMALTYAEHVNNHSLFLGVSSLLMLELFRWSSQPGVGASGLFRLGWIGWMVGAGYAIDLGVGPPLIVAVGVFLLFQKCSPISLAAFACGMAPWLILHHAVNYMVGGTLAPANANAAYFQWPGCSFNGQNMTGGWHHAAIGEFILYSLSLLFGKRGFFGHNLPLFMMLPALGLIFRNRSRESSPAIFAVLWSTLTWLMYAVNSTNSSGLCCSIRWFLPLLAPGYFLIAVALRDRPAWRPAFFVLSGWGLLLAAQMYGPGPWMQHMVPFFWQIQAAAFASLLIWAACRNRSASATSIPSSQSPSIQGRAA